MYSLTRLPCVRHIPIMTSQPNANSSSEAGPPSAAATAGYTLVLAVGAAFQWGKNRYHAARIGLLEEYVRETPAWIVEIQRIVRGG